MSRTQWYCLMAVLAVALGLFCGPGKAASDDAVRAFAPAVATAGADTVRAASPARPGPHAASADPGEDATFAGTAVVSAVDGHRMPGCGKSRKREDGEPALPGRARAAHDQAPGLAEWGLPAATGADPVGPPVRIRLRGPAPAAPTPVELSVLRV
ncbi:hypothetical protein ACIRP2_16810 [Streptomyces sp. NPDC101194]|uniref:hypothetical protein n=1 Tax=Streptomyces sp. NPDC101194 TaxID=3366127 RepID=UPI003828C80D